MIRRSSAQLVACMLSSMVSLAAARPAMAVITPSVSGASERLMQHPEALDEALVPLVADLAPVDASLVKVMVYVQGQQEFAGRAEARLVANAVTGRLVGSGRFQVVDCRECTLIHLTVASGSLHLATTLESEDELRQRALRSGADAVMLINPLVASDDQIDLIMSLVRGSDGEVVWSGRYPVALDALALKRIRQRDIDQAYATALAARHLQDTSLSVYAGVLGYGIDRPAASAGAADGTFSLMPGIGMRGLKRLGESPLWLGIDIAVDRAAQSPGTGDITLVTAMPVVHLSFDPLWGGLGNVFSVFLGGGPGLAIGGQGFLVNGAQAGMQLDFPANLSITLGAIYVPTFSLPMYPDPSYQSQVTFGGLAYRATTGVTF